MTWEQLTGIVMAVFTADMTAQSVWMALLTWRQR
jgi:hypothetical protein